jgi:apolipoprotein N-acyltransferase
MKTSRNTKNFWQRPEVLLLIGGALIVSSGMRWNVSVAAWLFPVPFLYYLRLGHSKKWLLFTLVISFILQIGKIASESMYLFIAISGGLSTGIFAWVIFIVKEKIRKTQGEWISVYSFAVLVTVSEFINMYTSPLGTWGMMANTQVDNLMILQIVSVTGAAGIAFLISWFSALMETILNTIAEGKNDTKMLTQTGYFTIVIFMVYVFGALRLDLGMPAKTTQVFTVSSKKYNVMDVLNNEAARKDNNADVLNLMRSAAEKKPSLVVSNEGALFLTPEEVEGTFENLKNLSQMYSTDLVVGYIIYKGKGEKRFNKSAWFSRGQLIQNYHKQFVPIGEPAFRIPDTISVMDVPFGRASMAICYDFDSISITNAHGKHNSAIIALPSSDWRGIDPVHTQMTRIRAIENGYSVIRPVREATTEVYDNFGRTRAMTRWQESGNEIMEALVPVEPVSTFYKIAGNWFSWLNLLALLFVSGKTYLPKRNF